MGKRYIEIKEAKHTEMEWVVNKMGHGSGNTENIGRLRGLPYGCTKQDIDAFFSGMCQCFSFKFEEIVAAR